MFKNSDPSELDEYIFNAALNKEPIFEAYKEWCRIHGDTDYVHFEWMYYQCYRGNRKSPVKFSDLPMHVLEKVVGNLELFDRFAVRKVSRSLRTLIDNSNATYKEISINFRYSEQRIQLETLSIIYKKGGRSVYVKNEQSGETKSVTGFEASIISDIESVLKNPKLKIGRLEIVMDSENEEKKVQMDDFIKLLTSFKFQIHAEEIFIEDKILQESTLQILKKLEPGELKKIDLQMEIQSQWFKLMETKQWKKAKHFKCIKLPDCVFIENLFRFKTIHLDSAEMSEYDLMKIRDVALVFWGSTSQKAQISFKKKF